MLLSDKQIQSLGPLVINPFYMERVQPSSYDLGLASKLKVPNPNMKGVRLDFRQPFPDDLFAEIEMDYWGFPLAPGECFLGSTEEYVTCPLDVSIRVEGKSSVARLFVLPHVAAGWIDPGFKGQITLEIVNLGPWEIMLYPGMPIAQMNFTQMSSEVEKPYGSEGLGSHYQGQTGPTTSVGNRK